MHGIELRRQERRTIRLSAPRGPFSPAPGSMLPGSPLAASRPEPVARNGFSLARNCCRLSASSIPGSKLPGTSTRSKSIAVATGRTNLVAPDLSAEAQPAISAPGQVQRPLLDPLRPHAAIALPRSDPPESLPAQSPARCSESPDPG